MKKRNIIILVIISIFFLFLIFQLYDELTTGAGPGTAYEENVFNGCDKLKFNNLEQLYNTSYEQLSNEIKDSVIIEYGFRNNGLKKLRRINAYKNT